MPRKPPKPPIDDRLLDTAIEQFGRKGIEGASTRDIAAAAQTAMSSITYHYGGKDGLYLAAARHIATQMSHRFAATLQDAPPPEELDPQAALSQVLVLADGFLSVMLSAESAAWARFIVREQAEPTEAFAILWDQFMGPLSGRLVQLVQRAGGGRWRLPEARVRALSIVGQILIFRVSRATALRVTGWNEIGASQAGEIRRIAHENIRAILHCTEDVAI
jgi:AcrR family transcriptional regulator